MAKKILFIKLLPIIIFNILGCDSATDVKQTYVYQWEEVKIEGFVQPFVIVSNDGKYAYAIDASEDERRPGLYVSADKGKHWNLLGDGVLEAEEVQYFGNKEDKITEISLDTNEITHDKIKNLISTKSGLAMYFANKIFLLKGDKLAWVGIFETENANEITTIGVSHDDRLLLAKKPFPDQYKIYQVTVDHHKGKLSPVADVTMNADIAALGSFYSSADDKTEYFITTDKYILYTSNNNTEKVLEVGFENIGISNMKPIFGHMRVISNLGVLGLTKDLKRDPQSDISLVSYANSKDHMIKGTGEQLPFFDDNSIKDFNDELKKDSSLKTHIVLDITGNDDFSSFVLLKLEKTGAEDPSPTWQSYLRRKVKGTPRL